MFNNEPKQPTKLIMDAIEAGRMDEVMELMNIEHASERRYWFNGFATGYGTAASGLLIGLAIGKFINKMKDKNGSKEV